MNPTYEDYKTILKFYKIKNIEKLSKKEIKKYAIKKVTKSNKLPEPSAIAICKDSVVTRKKLKINRFTCKNKPKLIPNKKTRKNIQKIK
jgi:hypothetical protein